jgi:hypothetical protein
VIILDISHYVLRAKCQRSPISEAPPLKFPTLTITIFVRIILTFNSRPDWADDEELDDQVADSLPPSTTTTNKDGTKTIITWRFNDDGKKVKTTRRIRFTTHKEIVNPRVAERKSWSKFGLSAKDSAGPACE